MKKFALFVALVSLVMLQVALADDCDPCVPICTSIDACDPLCNPCDEVGCNDGGCSLTEKSIFDSAPFNNRFIGKKSKSRITLYGWVLAGVTANEYGVKNEYGGRTSAYGYNQRPGRQGMSDQGGNSSILMLEQPSDFKVNQLWLGAKRDLTDQFGVGFQADFVYGTDARYARNWGDQSFDYEWGSGDYFASFAQLYGTVGTKKLYLKVGKFAGSFAYEGLAATKEFFYTHANICYGRPLTTQGAIMEWKPNDRWTFSGGWTAGVFTSFENPYSDNSFLGKATYNFTKNAALTYKIFYSDKGRRSDAHNASIDCYNTLIFTWQMNKRWFYMGEVAVTDGKVYDSLGKKTGSDAWGVNNHLIYQVSDKLSLGLRGEFHHSRGSMFDQPAITGGKGGDLWEVTLAANYKLNPKLTLRPEVRYDYADYGNGYKPFGGDESEKGQLCGGMSFIATF